MTEIGLPRPEVSAIIVSYNAGDDLLNCIDALLEQNCPIEIIVVDNGSRDGSVERARARYSDVRFVLEGTNDGFAGGANRGAALARAENLFFLNPDVFVQPDCVSTLLRSTSTGPRAAISAPVIFDGAGRPEFGFTIDPLGDLAGLPAPGLPLYVSGCALMTNRAVFAAVGGFDSEFFMFCEDLDFCWRALLGGYDVQVNTSATALHRGGASTPGGYVTKGHLQVTAFRIALRERNTLATLMRCGPLVWLAAVLPLRLVRIAMMVVFALALRRWDFALALMRGVAWNVRRMPKLVRERAALSGKRKNLRSRILIERVRREIVSARVLREYGLPRFVDV